ERSKKLFTRLHRNAERALRENHHPIAEVCELFECQQRAFAKLSHVREQRKINFLRKIAKLLGALQCLWKNCICASGKIFASPLDDAIEIFDPARICPCDNHEIRVATRADRSFDFANHFLDIHNRFPSEMSAALWKFLVFNVTTGQTGGFEFPDRAVIPLWRTRPPAHPRFSPRRASTQCR